MSGYDIIGDVHAQGTRLELLLRNMGYTGAYFKHPDGRRPIFIGDLIDRGTEHAKTFDIVRRTGATVIMGNHEFNALCFGTEGRKGPIRRHTYENIRQHETFLAEYPYRSEAYEEVLRWFSTFPVYKDLGGIRLIHACWNDKAIAACAPFLKKSGLFRAAALHAYDQKKPSSFHRAVNILLKGPELKLPSGVTYPDAQGIPRTKTRLYWWKEDGVENNFFQHKELVGMLLSTENLNKAHDLKLKFNYHAQPIVFFGHYNLATEPELGAERAVCVNFKNRLVAYRWNHGDAGARADRLVFV